jgi:tetratricopeptide (TPR) repeat protein
MQRLAALGNSLGRILVDCGRKSEAVPWLERALAVCRQLHGAEHRDSLVIQVNLANACASTGRVVEALSLAREARTKLEHTGKVADKLSAMRTLGFVYLQANSWDEAIPLLEDARKQHIEVFGSEDAKTLGVVYGLGQAYWSSGQPNRAAELLQGELEKFMRVLGAEAELTLLAMHDLGSALSEAGRLSEAIPMLLQSLEHVRRRFGQEHHETRVAMHNLGVAYVNAGDGHAAAKIFEELLEARVRLHGAQHAESLETSLALLEAYRLAGKFDQGRDLALAQLEVMRTQFDDIKFSSVLGTAVGVLLECQDFAGAEPLARECLRIRQVSQHNSWRYFNAQSLLGRTLLKLEKYSEAEPLLLSAIEGLDVHREAIPKNGLRHIEATVAALIKLYESTDQPEQAARWISRRQEWTTTPSSGE